MKEDLRLISSKMLEKNDICFTISLFSHHYENNIYEFSLYTDYLGFGMKDIDENYLGDSLTMPRFGQILSKLIKIGGLKPLNKGEYLAEIQRLNVELDALTFDDIASFLSNK